LDSLGEEYFTKIFVIDNSSSESTREFCNGYRLVEYSASENRGYGAGHNQAIEKSIALGADYHLVINSDIRFEPDIIEPLTEYMERKPDVGMIQPRIVNPDGSPQYTVRMLPSPLDLICRRFLPRNLVRKRISRYELHHFDHTKEFNVPYHQGSFMFLRIDALKKCGMFDERFFMYPEDIDLTRRIHTFYRTMYVPFVTVIHDHRAASYHSCRMLRVHIVNMIRYFNKWGWISDPERRLFNRQLYKQTDS